VSVWPYTDRWVGVVTKTGPYGGQHIRSWTKSVKLAKSPGQTTGPGQTNGHAWMGPKTPGDVVMKFSFWHPDRHTHTRQNLYILATRAVIKPMELVP